MIPYLLYSLRGRRGALTEEFEYWWNTLSAEEQESVRSSVILLQSKGVTLGAPHTTGIVTSRHAHMRELRIQHPGRPYRVFYAFDPLRRAVLLIGGDKTGQDRWHEFYVPLADRIYDDYLKELGEWKRMKARNFNELAAKMSPESRARSEVRAKEMLGSLPLDELRAAREMTQESLADILGVKQATVSKLERRTDMYISTLSRFIQAMGGTLEIRARFQDGDVRITQFSEEKAPHGNRR